MSFFVRTRLVKILFIVIVVMIPEGKQSPTPADSDRCVQ